MKCGKKELKYFSFGLFKFSYSKLHLVLWFFSFPLGRRNLYQMPNIVVFKDINLLHNMKSLLLFDWREYQAIYIKKDITQIQHIHFWKDTCNKKYHTYQIFTGSQDWLDIWSDDLQLAKLYSWINAFKFNFEWLHQRLQHSGQCYNRWLTSFQSCSFMLSLSILFQCSSCDSFTLTVCT